jgi:hypothetical protein
MLARGLWHTVFVLLFKSVKARGHMLLYHVTRSSAQRKGQGQGLAQGLALGHMSVHMTKKGGARQDLGA